MRIFKQVAQLTRAIDADGIIGIVLKIIRMDILILESSMIALIFMFIMR